MLSLSPVVASQYSSSPPLLLSENNSITSPVSVNIHRVNVIPAAVPAPAREKRRSCGPPIEIDESFVMVILFVVYYYSCRGVY